MTASSFGRRHYLRAMGGSVATIGVIGGSVTAAESEQVTLTGKLEAHDGAPIAGRKVSGNNGYVDTDSSGAFETQAEPNTRVKLGLYKSGGQLLAPSKNGVPHIDGLGYYSVGSSDKDIGTISVKKAHIVNLRALDAEGNPVSDAEFHVRADGYGSGAHMMTTNDSGYLVIRNADFTGIELVESAKVTITIPGNGGGEADKQYQERISVDHPTTVTAQEGEGTSITEHKPGESPETTTTTTQTTTETTTTTSAPTTTAMPTTTETTTTTGVSTTSQTSPQTTMRGMSDNNSGTRSKRGFFSNGEPAGNYEFLTNPFFLTVGGFVLSVAGIALNLIRGR